MIQSFLKMMFIHKNICKRKKLCVKQMMIRNKKELKYEL